MLAQVQKDYSDSVRVVYRHFPLPMHDKAVLTAQAAEAAGLQGKFWEMHDEIFAKQSEWASLGVAEATTWLVDQAVELGLEKDQFTQDLNSQAVVDKVKAAQSSASAAGISYTPFLLVDGRIFPDSVPGSYEMITSIIKLILIEDRQYTTCPPQVIDPARQYTATLKTEKGDIVIQLLPDKAPVTVNNFVFLAREGWYNNMTFHRVLEGFVAQTGDPTGTGFAGPGYAFANETSDLTFDQPGVVGMANSGADNNGSQFFITMAPAPDLNGGYTIFGRVIEGMEVVNAITPRDPQSQTSPPPGDIITEVIITEK